MKPIVSSRLSLRFQATMVTRRAPLLNGGMTIWKAVCASVVLFLWHPPRLAEAGAPDSLERARDMAQSWGSELVEAGDAGHINVDSGHGPWPDGLLRFGMLLKRLEPGSVGAPAA